MASFQPYNPFAVDFLSLPKIIIVIFKLPLINYQLKNPPVKNNHPKNTPRLFSRSPISHTYSYLVPVAETAFVIPAKAGIQVFSI